MPDYFVSVDTREGKREGYILANNRDVALVSFLLQENIPEDEVPVDAWTITKVYHLRMDRLNDYLGEPDPWGCDTKFTTDMISRSDGTITADTPFDDLHGPIPDNKWHATRIAYLIENPDQMLEPICVDNQLFMGRSYPIPDIIDGWHRYYAHLYLGLERIRCTYGGLVDLLHYLEGKTDELPPADEAG